MSFLAIIYSLTWLSRAFNIKAQHTSPTLSSSILYLPVQFYFMSQPSFFLFFPEHHCIFVHFTSTSKALITTPAQDKILAFYKIPFSKCCFLYKAFPDFLCNFKFSRQTKYTHIHTPQCRVVG